MKRCRQVRVCVDQSLVGDINQMVEMREEIRTEDWQYITREAVDLSKSYCITCQEKTKRTKSLVVVRPILTKDFNSRFQVDLIDMQSSPQAQHKGIMVYQCHLTKFVLLCPLTSKRVAEVAFQLLDIFLLIGDLCILESENESEFTA
ncbi:KRAB-A domain-containing protein 2-like [Palaemon carinicauda]|uniref:KRAB-A domain-containing protein 2-like n=1 Tax=Palaemon carinicauda TaxID=392227 RepID=UPI0035B609F0